MVDTDYIISPLDFKIERNCNEVKVVPKKDGFELYQDRKVIFLAGLQEDIHEYKPVNNWYSDFIINYKSMDTNNRDYIFIPRVDPLLTYFDFMNPKINNYSLLDLMEISNYVLDVYATKIVYNLDDEIKNSLLTHQFSQIDVYDNCELYHIICKEYDNDELNDEYSTDNIAQKYFVNNREYANRFTCISNLISHLVYGE